MLAKHAVEYSADLFTLIPFCTFFICLAKVVTSASGIYNSTFWANASVLFELRFSSLADAVAGEIFSSSSLLALNAPMVSSAEPLSKDPDSCVFSSGLPHDSLRGGHSLLKGQLGNTLQLAFCAACFCRSDTGLLDGGRATFCTVGHLWMVAVWSWLGHMGLFMLCEVGSSNIGALTSYSDWLLELSWFGCKVEQEQLDILTLCAILINTYYKTVWYMRIPLIAIVMLFVLNLHVF